jgi:hypothetical protein
MISNDIRVKQEVTEQNIAKVDYFSYPASHAKAPIV